MTILNSELLLLFFAAFFLTSLITPIMKSLALRRGITDKPIESHKTHTEPVPYLGGLAIVIGTLVVTYGSALLTNFTRHTFVLASSIMLPAILMAIIGLVDDIKQLSPWPRFVAQNFLALIATSILIVTNTMGAPFGIPLIDFLVTVIWLVGITNSVNFLDNIDGGASGTIAITSLALALIAFINGQTLITAMSIVLGGATMGFLLWNKPPARIYMGDAGALFLGILIASLTIRLDSSQALGRYGLLVPVLLLAMPILDTSVAVIKRVRRGVSPFQGGRDHLSHRLMRLGLKKRSTVMLLWLTSGIFSIFAIGISVNLYGLMLLLALLSIVFWLLLLIFFLKTRDE